MKRAFTNNWQITRDEVKARLIELGYRHEKVRGNPHWALFYPNHDEKYPTPSPFNPPNHVRVMPGYANGGADVMFWEEWISIVRRDECRLYIEEFEARYFPKNEEG